jgi:DNA-directed RNA polymerase subunit L
MPPKKAKSSILTPKIDIIGKDSGLFKFTLSNTNLSIANAIRRTVLSEIPIFAMKEEENGKKMIHIKKNTSQFNNQIIMQRLGCIPVHIDDITKNVDNLLIELNIKNDSDGLLFVTTEDIKIYQILDDSKVNGELPEKTVKKIFPANKYTKDYILLARLKPKITEDIPGEELSLTAKLSKCSAKESGMFNVVSTCAYGFTPDPVKQHDAEDAFETQLKSTDIDEEVLEYNLKNWKNHNAKRHYIENSFDFKMESIGIYENEKLIKLACDIIIKKLQYLIDSIDNNTIKIQEEAIALENSYDITLKNENYTLGKVIEYILHYKYYLDEGILNYIGFLKPHPHEKNSLIRLAMKKETDYNKDKLYIILKDSCNIGIKIFETIRNDFK